MKTGTISKKLTVDSLTGRFVITIISDGSADEKVLTIGWYERPYPHKGDRVAYSLSPARLEIINGKEHVKTAKPEPETETPEDTLVSLDLETTMDGETVISLGLATLKGGRIRKEQGTADTEGNWKRQLIQKLTSAKAITGHNVFGHDYRKLFGKSVPEHIQAKTWDTWEREQVLEPLRHSFALRTTHRPDEDAANALMLAASQIRRTETATEEQKENMKARNEPLYRLLISLISGLPHDIPGQEVASKYSTLVHRINRFYPSSRLCDCGYKNDALKLNDREWTCPVCGAHHDRDLLAAQNIYRRGITDLGSTCKTGFAG